MAALMLCVSAFAQGNGTNGSSYAPKKGDWQISLNLGSGNFLPTEDLELLLPDNKITTDGTLDDLGIGTGDSENQSQESAYLLNLGSFNENSLLNIAGIQFGYFLTDKIELNANFSMSVAANPSIDYIEGVSLSDDSTDILDIPAYEYMEATVSSKYMGKVGANYYFNTKADRIQLYAGAAAGFGYARIEATTPYTGVEVETEDGSSDPVELYQSSYRAGSIQSYSGMLNAGAVYNFNENLNLGFEISPVSYSYSFIQMTSQGMSYYATHHYIKAFSFPTVKFGMILKRRILYNNCSGAPLARLPQSFCAQLAVFYLY